MESVRRKWVRDQDFVFTSVAVRTMKAEEGVMVEEPNILVTISVNTKINWHLIISIITIKVPPKLINEIADYNWNDLSVRYIIR